MVVSELSAEQFIWALWLSFDNGCCLSMVYVKSKILKTGVYLFVLKEWICSVGYTMFLWSENSFQNFMHLAVTVIVVVLSVVLLVVIFIGARKESLIV